jgi:glycine hydroxymethyltransferase
VQYGLNADTGLIDYEQVEALALEHKPAMIIAGFSAYSGIMDWARFREIADKVGAYLLVDMAHVSGLVAAGVYPSPIPHAHVVTSTTHKTLRGPRGGFVLTNDEDIAKKVNSAVFPGSQGGPLCHVIAAKAVAFKEAASDEFVEYQKRVVANAQAMAKTFIERGIKIVSNGTENHLMLVDLIGKEYTGTDADRAMGEAFITVNKNAVPNDPRSPFVTSGLRVGTPAITTRGFGVEESVQLTHWMCDILDGLENGNSEQIIAEVKAKVLDICERFPVYK